MLKAPSAGLRKRTPRHLGLRKAHQTEGRKGHASNLHDRIVHVSRLIEGFTDTWKRRLCIRKYCIRSLKGRYEFNVRHVHSLQPRYLNLNSEGLTRSDLDEDSKEGDALDGSRCKGRWDRIGSGI